MTAAVLPIDLEIDRKVARYKIRKRGDFTIQGIEISREVIASGRVHSLEAKRTIENALVNEWQQPGIEDRLRREWLKPDHFTSQFLSGHGSFKSYLYSRGHSEDPS